jgi:hypothetical protein
MRGLIQLEYADQRCMPLRLDNCRDFWYHIIKLCQRLELFLMPLSFERDGKGISGIPGGYLPPYFLLITPSRSGPCPIDNIIQFRGVRLGEVSLVCPADGDSYDIDVGRLF